MDNILLAYRRRIIGAALRRHKAKTASDCLIINFPNGKIKTVQLTQDVLNGLFACFELKVLGEIGASEGIKQMAALYDSAINVCDGGEYLTDQGKFIVDELLKELADVTRNTGMRGKKDGE